MIEKMMQGFLIKMYLSEPPTKEVQNCPNASESSNWANFNGFAKEMFFSGPPTKEVQKRKIKGAKTCFSAWKYQKINKLLINTYKTWNLEVSTGPKWTPDFLNSPLPQLGGCIPCAPTQIDCWSETFVKNTFVKQLTNRQLASKIA